MGYIQFLLKGWIGNQFKSKLPIAPFALFGIAAYLAILIFLFWGQSNFICAALLVAAFSCLLPGIILPMLELSALVRDLVVPIVSLGQEAAWAPSTTRGPWGWWLWGARWWLISLGWIVTAIGAAAVTGVIRRD